MTILDVNGRPRSERTDEEELRILREDIERLPLREQAALKEVYASLLEQESEPYKALSEAEYKVAPVDIRTFLTEPYFLGETGASLWPKLTDDLVALFEGNYEEATLGGSLGWGKSFFSTTAMTYVLYQMSCLRNPQRAYGIDVGSHIYVAMISVTEKVAKRVVINELLGKIRYSRYFQEHFPSNEAPSQLEVRFRDNIQVVAGSTTSSAMIGLNVFSGLIDECVAGWTRVLTPYGYRTIDELYDGDGTITPIMSYSEKEGRVVRSSGRIKRATNTKTFDVVFSNGAVVTATSEHPFLVRGYGYVPLEKLRVGDEVVVVDAEEVQQAKLPGGRESVLRQEAFRGNEEENIGGSCGCEACSSFRGDEKKDCVVQYQDEGNQAGYRHRGDSGRRVAGVCGSGEGAQKAGKRGSATGGGVDGRETPAIQRDQKRNVGGFGFQGEDEGASSSSTSHSGIQGCPGRAESEQGFRSLRGDKAKAQRGDGQEVGTVDVQVSRVGRYEEGGAVRIPFAVGEDCYRDTGGRRERREFRVRAIRGAVYTRWQETVDASGFPCANGGWFDGDDRGEAKGVFEVRDQSVEIRGLPGLLREEGLDLRGLGRESNLARVVSIRASGNHPTFDVMSIPHGNFIAEGVVVHNTSFLGESKKLDRLGREILVDQGEAIYKSIIRRMKSRFQRVGRLPGVLILASSKERPAAFIEKRVQQAREMDDPMVFCREYATWDVQPAEKFSGKFFKVVVGNERIASRILPDDEPEEETRYRELGLQIVTVPEDYRNDFLADIDGALRDIAGVATDVISQYLNRTEKVYDSQDQTLDNPVGYEDGGEDLESWVANTPLPIQWHRIATQYKRRVPGGYEEEAWRPKRHPQAVRYAHIDPSLTGDRSGICIAHIAGWTEVVRRDSRGEEYNELAPRLETDLVLQVIPPPGDEIMLADLRGIIYQFVEHGFHIGYVSLDSFQSVDTIQQLRKHGMEAEVVSVDRTTEPYDVLKAAMYEDRFRMQKHSVALQEFRTLQRVPHGRGKVKIDHPKRNPDGTPGSKDVADSIAGVVYSLTQRVPGRPMPPMMSTREGFDEKQDDTWVTEGRVLVQSTGKPKKPPSVAAAGNGRQSMSMPFVRG